MDGGGVGELIGIALLPVGWLVGRRFGPRREKKFWRIVSRVIVAWLALAVLLALIWWAIAS
jgi:hypothetical protein